jgi:hypothetical protein
MSTRDEQLDLTLPSTAAWTRPRGKSTCGRDPAAGPGTCHHWWDGCPKAEKRGCYLLHLRTLNEAGLKP